MTLDAKVDQPEIGRWGEMLVHNYLIQQQEGSACLIVLYTSKPFFFLRIFNFRIKPSCLMLILRTLQK